MNKEGRKEGRERKVASDWGGIVWKGSPMLVSWDEGEG